MKSTDTVMADSRDMIGAHIGFRREFGALPGAVRRVAPGNVAQAAAVAKHAEFIVDFMHHHHRGEDIGVWPRLLERCPADVKALVDIMQEHHARLDQGLEDIRAWAQRWGATAAAEDRDNLAHVAERLLALLHEHLDLEEAKILPLIDGYLTEKEWKEVVAGEAASIPKSQLPLVLGMMLYDADDVLKSIMKTTVPRPLWPIVSLVGRRAYAKHAARVLGTATPTHYNAYRAGARNG